MVFKSWSLTIELKLCSDASVGVRGCGDEIVSGWRDVTDIEHWRIGLGVEAFVASVGQNYDMP